ncbi:serine hydrolase domain-containing protein [Singulisphaera rosea]
MIGYSRRKFLQHGGGGLMALALETGSLRAEASGDSLDDFLEAEMLANRIPGLAACIVKSGKVVWSKGYGWADIKRRVAMDPERSIQNIGSISKTVTATAAMQLWEKGKFDLDDDVGRYLPFPVRNPAYPDEVISFRDLLTHRSSIADSPAYGESYACGDPVMSLESWIKDYFTTDGRYYQKEKNFHPWKPGEKYRYSNVGFGLIGYLVERLSGQSFAEFTKTSIFDPLGMSTTGWMVSGLAAGAHAVPYVPVIPKKTDEDIEVYRKFGILAGEVESDPVRGVFQPLCAYSFPNYPDGSLRTSVTQLARFLLAYINQGQFGGKRILEPETVRLMLTRQNPTPTYQGLCWVMLPVNGQEHWFHNGSDPGIRTNMSFRSSDGVGAIVFANRTDIELTRINDRLFQESARF